MYMTDREKRAARTREKVLIVLMALAVVLLFYNIRKTNIAYTATNERITLLQIELEAEKRKADVIFTELLRQQDLFDKIWRQREEELEHLKELKEILGSATVKTFKMTSYSLDGALAGDGINGNGDGKTASGTWATVGRTVAVDPRVVPHGTWMWVKGYGLRRAEDVGPAIKGMRIDMLVQTDREAFIIGNGLVDVVLLPGLDV